MANEIFPIEDWLLNLPLYTPVELGDHISEAIQAIQLFTGTMDAYCPECMQSSTFMALVSEGAKKQKQDEDRLVAINRLAMVAGTPRDNRKIWELPEFSKAIACTRAGHFAHFHFILQDKKFIKTGQYPSLADMATGDTSQFEKALGKARLHELNKAIGLAAHGVGIGAYVYLRRVFESLVEESHQRALRDGNWDEIVYQQARMREKVSMLKMYLPEFIVGNPALYSILSLGVHELTEEECRKNFEALKSGILVIAEERLHEIQRQQRYRDATQAIAAIPNSVRKK